MAGNRSDALARAEFSAAGHAVTEASPFATEAMPSIGAALVLRVSSCDNYNIRGRGRFRHIW